MSNFDNMKKSVYAMIEELAGAEKITKRVFGQLSRDMLLYVPQSQDIAAVNRLLEVLSPINRKAGFLFFGALLPWELERDADGKPVRFGKKMQGEKKLAKRDEAIKNFLENEKNTIWTWADDNIEMKQIDFSARVMNVVKKALAGDEKTNTPALSQAQLVDSLFRAGVTLDAMLEGCSLIEEAQKEVEQQVMEQEAEKVAA